jgi:hypothetical protein
MHTCVLYWYFRLYPVVFCCLLLYFAILICSAVSAIAFCFIQLLLLHFTPFCFIWLFLLLISDISCCFCYILLFLQYPAFFLLYHEIFCYILLFFIICCCLFPISGYILLYPALFNCLSYCFCYIILFVFLNILLFSDIFRCSLLHSAGFPLNQCVLQHPFCYTIIPMSFTFPYMFFLLLDINLQAFPLISQSTLSVSC